MKQLIPIIGMCMLFWTCNKPDAPDCFQQAGETRTEWRSLPSNDGIEIHDNIEVVLVHSDKEAIAVEGPANLLPEITTETENGILHIRNNNHCNFVRSYKHKYVVKIYSEHLTSIINRGNGDVTTSNTIRGHYLFFENKRSTGKIDLQFEMDSMRFLNTTGYSDIRLRGVVQQLFLFHQGVGILDASQVNANAVFINSNTINDSYVRFREYMFAVLNDNGNIYYNGPSSSIDVDHVGAGSLIAQ
jgi:hypothetical protein